MFKESEAHPGLLGRLQRTASCQGCQLMPGPGSQVSFQSASAFASEPSALQQPP